MPKDQREDTYENFTLRLPTRLRAALERAAERQDRTSSAIIRRALIAHLRADGELTA